MNKTDFISLIEQPETLGKSHITALKNIAADFPYFQNAQLLLTKALYNEKHYEFEKQLKYASIMHPDRAVLFRYIHNLTGVPAESSASNVLAKEEKALPDVQKTIEIIEKEQEIPVTIEPEPEIAQTEPEPLPAVELITETPEPEPVIAIEEQEQPVLHENYVTETVILTEPSEEQEIAPVTTETHSFMEWLTLQKTGAVGDHAGKDKQPETGELVSPAIESPEEPADKQPLSMQEEIAGQVERSSNVREFESILDKFIRENPRISRGKAEFYSPINMAKQSVEQDEEIVSETLANIYYKQGHYKKAIRVYEKLCLLYPHKLSYFADLIQKIKTENKD